MSSPHGITISAGRYLNFDPPQTVTISPCARNVSPFLASLDYNSGLPMPHPRALHIVLAHLEQRTNLSAFRSITGDGGLLLFARTWTLAAQLGLPDLQNALVDEMTGVYRDLCQVTGPCPRFPPDDTLEAAFAVLNDVRHDYKAERFLVWFVACLAPDLTQLEAGIATSTVEPGVAREILSVARGFDRDAIRCRNAMFRFTRIDVRHCEFSMAVRSDGMFSRISLAIPVRDAEYVYSAGAPPSDGASGISSSDLSYHTAGDGYMNADRWIEEQRGYPCNFFRPQPTVLMGTRHRGLRRHGRGGGTRYAPRDDSRVGIDVKNRRFVCQRGNRKRRYHFLCCFGS
ncbi:hypothetical protein K458DRAFT_383632 [Lentithecium fluviatile CBS 122367]|uniref:Uncharacterized protein n=1 Tax=Lentithecium fluviatile CBS 122367 TaxID=1168545 RepID=A0A6G1JK39_9PLEO|nr:hypothetical protein K458DRAFT_383632 [Lentithecium fluviatile CBS 122367]